MNTNFFRVNVNLTPVITANSAYGTGNQLGPAASELQKVLPGPAGITVLQSIEVIDADNQKAAIDFLFWNALPTVTGTDKNAFSVTTAELKQKLVATVSIAAGDYISIGTAQGLATKYNLQVPVQSNVTKESSNPTGKSLFVSMIVRATATWTTTSGLLFRFKFQ